MKFRKFNRLKIAAIRASFSPATADRSGSEPGLPSQKREPRGRRRAHASS